MKFEVIRAESGEHRWQLRERNGRIVRLRPGKIMVPRATAAAERKLKRAVDVALAAMAEKDDAVAGVKG